MKHGLFPHIMGSMLRHQGDYDHHMILLKRHTIQAYIQLEGLRLLKDMHA